jgi:hypothetical protein
MHRPDLHQRALLRQAAPDKKPVSQNPVEVRLAAHLLWKLQEPVVGVRHLQVPHPVRTIPEGLPPWKPQEQVAVPHPPVQPAVALLQALC